MKYKSLLYIFLLGIITACSTTSNLEEGEVLYTGLMPIDHRNAESNEHHDITMEEVEAALATAPNGALFGSSFYRTPFPYGLWIWNSCNGSSGVFKKWLNKSFGKAPVLISNVNPELRSSVAQNVLQNNGYFNSDVTYDIIDGKPKTTKHDTVPMPRTAKIQYHVDYGHLFTFDSISYSNYPDNLLKLIQSEDSYIHRNDAFSVSTLDSERTRIYNLLRNHGYYNYQPSYTSYLADTLKAKGKVQVQLHLADSLPEDAMRKWVIGTTTMQIRREQREELTDSVRRNYLTILFGGKKSPLRPRVILRDLKMRPGDLFSQNAYQESLNNMQSKGIFSTAEITFKPRIKPDGTLLLVSDTVKATKNGEERAGAGVLDMLVNAVLDKPYDVTFQADAVGKTNNRLGPGVSLGFNKRNAFGGGELFSASVGANYEFQTGGELNMGNSYDFTTDLSLTLPRLWLPNFIRNKALRRRWYTTPSTMLSLSGEIIRRAGFFTRNVIGGDFSYIFQPSVTSIHQFSPLVVTYGRTYNITNAYQDKLNESMMMTVATANEMTLRMRYKYSYSSPQSNRNPIYWEAVVTEAGNLYNLINMAMNKCSWNTKGRTLFKSEFSQFLKFETDFRKTWAMSDKSTVVAHFNGGIIKSLGNAENAPFAEEFSIGGANDLRGFSMRSVGPGALHFPNTELGYLFHNGDLKMVFNLEYRPHLFGSLYGALFLDAGNIWALEGTSRFDEYKEEYGNPHKIDIAMNTGFGFRYDLDFFVLRLDWGFAFHAPYSTHHTGFFNLRNFKEAQCINFAIGYPF